MSYARGERLADAGPFRGRVHARRNWTFHGREPLTKISTSNPPGQGGRPTPAGAAHCGNTRHKGCPGEGSSRAQVMLVGGAAGTTRKHPQGEAVCRSRRALAPQVDRGSRARAARLRTADECGQAFRLGAARGKRRIHRTPAPRSVAACAPSSWRGHASHARRGTAGRGALPPSGNLRKTLPTRRIFGVRQHETRRPFRAAATATAAAGSDARRCWPRRSSPWPKHRSRRARSPASAPRSRPRRRRSRRDIRADRQERPRAPRRT